MIGALILIAGIAIMLSGGSKDQSKQVTKPNQPKAQAPAETRYPPGHQKSIFDVPGQTAPAPGQQTPPRPQPLVVPPADPPTPRPNVSDPPPTLRTVNPPPQTPANENTAPPVDTRVREQAWIEIEEISRSTLYSNAPLALHRFVRYKLNYPNTPFAAELQQYIDDACERIWWQRVLELYKARDAHQRQVEEINTILADAGSDEFSKKQTVLLTAAMQKRDKCQELLQVMSYSAKEPPLLTDPTNLGKHAAARDKAVYEKWKASVIKGAEMTDRRPFPAAP